MKRWLASMLTALALVSTAFAAPAAFAPADANAWPSTLKRTSLGLHSADCTAVFGSDYTEALVAILADETIRCSMDFNNGASFYNGVISWAAQNGVELLPILQWGAPGNTHKPNGPAERALLQQYGHDIAYQLVWAYALNGMAFPNVVELGNEPNCDQAYSLGGRPVLDEYWNNTYIPLKNGVKSINSQINVTTGGLASTNKPTCNTNGAPNWVQAIMDRGYSSEVNAYAIHAYGRTGDESSGAINAELGAVCDIANRQVLITEVGKPSNKAGSSEAIQNSTMNVVHDYFNVHPGLRLFSNWPGRDTTGVGDGSSGFLRTDNSGKPLGDSMNLWASGHTTSGDLSNTHC